MERIIMSSHLGQCLGGGKMFSRDTDLLSRCLADKIWGKFLSINYSPQAERYSLTPTKMVLIIRALVRRGRIDSREYLLRFGSLNFKVSSGVLSVYMDTIR